MLQVIIPMAVLLIIVLCKKLPLIGGNINAALLITGMLTLLMGGIYNPAQWLGAWVDGLNRMAWIMALSITGAIFAEISTRLGTVDTIIGALTAKFGNRPRLLIVCILLALTVAGSLLGDAIAAATVIGILTIGILVSMGLSLEKISAIIMMGAAIGSIMPPMTQALALASTLVNTDPDPVINLGYLTVSIVFLACALYCSLILVKKENVPGADPSVIIKHADRTAGEILKEHWKSLIPLFTLVVIVLLRTVKIPYISCDIGPAILKSINFIKVGDDQFITLYDFLANATILGGLTNGIVLSIICAIAVSFFFPTIRKNGSTIIRESMDKVSVTLVLQICCSFMLGTFYVAGSIDAVSAFAQGLNGHVLKIGGAAAMLLLGMLTGSQSTTQNVVFSFFGPALVAFGLNPTLTAVAGANLAAAGQGMPPADLTTFVICGMITAQTGKKCDPLKSMFYSMPMCILFLIVGMIFLYI